MKAFSLIKKFISRKDGATAIEYGLIAAGIALVILPAVQQIGTHSSATYTQVADALVAPDENETGGCQPMDPCGAPGGDDGGDLESGGGPIPLPPVNP